MTIDYIHNSTNMTEMVRSENNTDNKVTNYKEKLYSNIFCFQFFSL